MIHTLARNVKWIAPVFLLVFWCSPAFAATYVGQSDYSTYGFVPTAAGAGVITSLQQTATAGGTIEGIEYYITPVSTPSATGITFGILDQTTAGSCLLAGMPLTYIGAGGLVTLTASDITTYGTCSGDMAGGVIVSGHSYNVSFGLIGYSGIPQYSYYGSATATSYTSNEYGPLPDPFWQVADTAFPPTNTQCMEGFAGTCIDSVSPADNSTVATATPYTEGATGFVTAYQAPNGASLQFRVNNAAQQFSGGIQGITDELVCWGGSFINANNDNPACGNITVPLATNEPFFYSTSTPAVEEAGTYTMTTTIIAPDFSFLDVNLGQKTLASKTTTFLAAATTTYDTLSVAQLTAIQALTGGATFSQDNCNPAGGSFDIGLCIDYLIVPTQVDFQADLTSVQTGLLNRAPWGYAYRIVNLFTSTTTPAALPESTIPIYIGSTTTPAENLIIDPQDTIVGGAAFLNSFHAFGSGLTLRQIVEPFVDLFIGISLMIIVFHDLMAMGAASKGRGRGEGGGKNNRNSDSYREWLYTHKK